MYKYMLSPQYTYLQICIDNLLESGVIMSSEFVCVYVIYNWTVYVHMLLLVCTRLVDRY